MASARAITPSVILLVAKERMVKLRHRQHGLSDRFISHMLARNIRIEEDLVDQLFNSSPDLTEARRCCELDRALPMKSIWS